MTYTQSPDSAAVVSAVRVLLFRRLASPSLPPENDHELLMALSRGEPEAIAVLYQRHGARMIAFARRYVRHQGAAEDVVVGLLGKWLERPPQVVEAPRIAAFLATSVYHAAIDWIRHERAEQGQSPRGEPAAASPDGRVSGPLTHPSPESSPESLRPRLAAALTRLSAGDRLLLETHYGQALSPEDCMDVLQISRAAFHQRLHRARTRLARALAGEEVANLGGSSR
jgi:RNA polymerase sigma factor (sigma-70 family)